jgi:hypothetical protein
VLNMNNVFLPFDQEVSSSRTFLAYEVSLKPVTNHAPFVVNIVQISIAQVINVTQKKKEVFF